ncbi:MAG: baseplate J/gp47 family protein [Rhizobiales bacterium]|nr:baseplate J/gp47 family protein [Hyphomicrobiales bacterium]
MVVVTAAWRFEAPELLELGSPPTIAVKPYQTLLDQTLTRLAEEFVAAGIDWDVGRLNANPGSILSRVAAYRDRLRLQAIDDAVAETYLGSASELLDWRAADYGVTRRVVQLANPLTNTPEILEDDDSLRLRARLAWEALSVAGPQGGYVFHALDAHPGVYDAIAIGPESGIVQPGEVLVVLQGREGYGVPSDGIVDVIAARLDAYEVIYSSGASVVRPVRDDQSVRPLGARVTIAAARPLLYTTTATLYVSSYTDAEAIRLEAIAKLKAYQEKMRRIWRRVSKEGRQAALSLVGTDGLPVIDEAVVDEDDVQPSHLEIPVGEEPVVTVVVR